MSAAIFGATMTTKLSEPPAKPEKKKTEAPTGPRYAYSINEWCALTGLSRSFIYAEHAADKLRLRKVGTKTVILHDEGMAWLRGGTASAA